MTPALRLDGVTRDPILAAVDLTLGRGEVLALCGASGSGKTTLLRVVAGLTPFGAGSLTVDGVTVRAGTTYPERLYGRVGLVFQEHTLFPHLTALGNVTLGLRRARRLPAPAARDRARAELDRMGVLGLADRYPATLSGGERQRVAIARSLALDPALLLLDEPTASLDPDRADEVTGHILALARAGTTMVLVTHAVALARQAATTFALLHDGRLRSGRDPAILDQLRVRR